MVNGEYLQLPVPGYQLPVAGPLMRNARLQSTCNKFESRYPVPGNWQPVYSDSSFR
jgi:hypothetical protein